MRVEKRTTYAITDLTKHEILTIQYYLGGAINPLRDRDAEPHEVTAERMWRTLSGSWSNGSE